MTRWNERWGVVLIANEITKIILTLIYRRRGFCCLSQAQVLFFWKREESHAWNRLSLFLTSCHEWLESRTRRRRVALGWTKLMDEWDRAGSPLPQVRKQGGGAWRGIRCEGNWMEIPWAGPATFVRCEKVISVFSHTSWVEVKPEPLPWPRYSRMPGEMTKAAGRVLVSHQQAVSDEVASPVGNNYFFSS